MAAGSTVATAVGHALSHGAQPLTSSKTRDTAPAAMRCEVCGNEYEAPLEIHVRGQRGVFDCFECAIQALAPACAHCQCRVIGHGIAVDGVIYCCAHCARAAGAAG